MQGINQGLWLPPVQAALRSRYLYSLGRVAQCATRARPHHVFFASHAVGLHVPVLFGTCHHISQGGAAPEGRPAAFMPEPVTRTTCQRPSHAPHFWREQSFTPTSAGFGNRVELANRVSKIRLSSDGDNPLNGSRNWWADGDGWPVCT
jgi:hypothetical protein